MKTRSNIRHAALRLLLGGYILIFCATSNCLGQSNTFTPVAQNEFQLKALAFEFEKQFKEELAALPSKNKKDFEEVYQLRWNNIKSKFDNGEIYTSIEAQSYLDALVAELVKANPLLQSKKIHCYFSRSGIPNASYIGEGIILFNMGLFHRLRNESEVAFVLAHELSHLCLQHSENGIRDYVTTINSEATQKELRKIQGTAYGKRAQLEKLMKGLTFDSRRHGRDHESEADSMALELMRHTGFDVSKSLTTLNLLDSIDIDTLNTADCLQQLFNSKEYPFQKKWIAKEEGLLGGHAQLKKDEPLADSLKTHPDCQSRIRRLQPMVEQYKSPLAKADLIDASKLDRFKNSFRYEIIDYSYHSGNYCRSLYSTMELLREQPSDPYLITQTGRIFNGFFQAQKTHTLGKVTALPSPYYPSNYNLLLQFIQNLYLENFAALSFHFLKQYETSLENYSPFKDVFSTSKQIVQQ